MVNVLVLGATGFIGYPVAIALRRAGHIVYAVVRDTEAPKAKDLERQEILTHKGDGMDSSTWTKLAATMDVVIDAADHMLGGKIFSGVLDAAKTRPQGAPKLTYIYTSGIWVHGDSIKQVTDRSLLPGVVPPMMITSWRPALEQQILSSREYIDPIIVRPGLVFGGASTIFSFWFGALLEAKAKGVEAVIPAKKDALVGPVHKEDLADAYRLIVEKSSLLANISSPIFDITNPVESVNQIIIAAGQALGLEPAKITFVQPPEGLIEAISTSVVTSSERARDLLGWQARHPSISAGMEIYMRAFLAHQQATA